MRIKSIKNMREEQKTARARAKRDKPRPVRACTRVRDGETQRRVITRDPEAPRRHEEWGRRPQRAEQRIGGSEATKRAREEVFTRTLECGRCGHLVDWRACKRAAFDRHPAELRRGDGCLGRKCGKRSATKAERARAMRMYCAALMTGERKLVAWPGNAEDTDVWERPDESKARIVERMTAMYGHE